MCMMCPVAWAPCRLMAAHTHQRTHPRTRPRAHPREDLLSLVGLCLAVPLIDTTYLPIRQVLDAPDIVRVLASAVGDEDEQVPRYIAEPCMMAWPRILFDPLPMTFTHAARTRMSLRVQVGGEDGDAMITCENAHAMARMALKDRYGQIDHDGLDFIEYMCAQVTSAGRWTSTAVISASISAQIPSQISAPSRRTRARSTSTTTSSTSPSTTTCPRRSASGARRRGTKESLRRARDPDVECAPSLSAMLVMVTDTTRRSCRRALPTRPRRRRSASA